MTGVDFSDPKQSQEYIERIGREYRYGCLEENNPESCHLMGDYLEAIEHNPQKSYETYKENCERFHFGPSCYKYGRHKLVGKYCDVDPVRAFWALNTSCSRDFDMGCYYQSWLMYSGVPGKLAPDPPAALAPMKKACELGMPKACFTLSGWFFGNPQGTADRKFPVDMQKCLEYGISACEKGDHQACANVSYLYKEGKFGIEQSEVDAAVYKKKADDITESVREKTPLIFTG